MGPYKSPYKTIKSAPIPLFFLDLPTVRPNLGNIFEPQVCAAMQNEGTKKKYMKDEMANGEL
jgi:hypothetical protein